MSFLAATLPAHGAELPAAYLNAVGRTDGCTATLVSPPGAAMTAMVLAAHCGNMPKITVNGNTVEGFECLSNKYFNSQQDGRGGSADDDVEVCFSKQVANIPNQAVGCIASREVQKGNKLRLLGYGNPQFNEAQVRKLPTDAFTFVDHVQPAGPRTVRGRQVQGVGGAIIGRGGSYVTPGDSGGPVVLMDDETQSNGWGDGTFFNFIGVNSKVGFPRTGPESIFAPFSAANMDFFQRAIAKMTENGGETPQICGVNWTPTGMNNNNGNGGMGGTDLLGNPLGNGNGQMGNGNGDLLGNKPMPPNNGMGGNHNGTMPMTPPQRPTDNRTRARAIGELLKANFPKTTAEVPAYLRWIAQNDAMKTALTGILNANPATGELTDFLIGLGATPLEVLAELKKGLNGQNLTTQNGLQDPQNAANTPWMPIFKDLSGRTPQLALDVLAEFRKLAMAGDAKTAELYAYAARWAASLTVDQRTRAKGLLANLKLNKDGVPADVNAADEKILRYLKAAVEPTGNAAGAQAQAQARQYAINWNKTLFEAVGDGLIDLNQALTAHEKGDEKTTVRDWTKGLIKDFGHDELLAWARSVGGKTGQKVQALVALYDLEEAKKPKPAPVPPAPPMQGPVPMPPPMGAKPPTPAPQVPPVNDGKPKPVPAQIYRNANMAMVRCQGCHTQAAQKASHPELSNATGMIAKLKTMDANQLARTISRMAVKGMRSNNAAWKFTNDEMVALRSYIQVQNGTLTLPNTTPQARPQGQPQVRPQVQPQGQPQVRPQVRPQGQPQAQQQQRDAYGRLPGDPHYGHNHPS